VVAVAAAVVTAEILHLLQEVEIIVAVETIVVVPIVIHAIVNHSKAELKIGTAF
jgi:hypothetical protein